MNILMYSFPLNSPQKGNQNESVQRATRI